MPAWSSREAASGGSWSQRAAIPSLSMSRVAVVSGHCQWRGFRSCMATRCTCACSHDTSSPSKGANPAGQAAGIGTPGRRRPWRGSCSRAAMRERNQASWGAVAGSAGASAAGGCWGVGCCGGAGSVWHSVGSSVGGGGMGGWGVCLGCGVGCCCGGSVEPLGDAHADPCPAFSTDEAYVYGASAVPSLGAACAARAADPSPAVAWKRNLGPCSRSGELYRGARGCET